MSSLLPVDMADPLQQELYNSMSKLIDSGADMTMFGQLVHLEKKTVAINNSLCGDIETIKELQGDFTEMQKQAKTITNQTRVKLVEDVKRVEQRIRNYLSLQKIQNQRFATQITEMSQNDKQIAQQLDFLQARFQDFEKNVYGGKQG